jgi:hypothetical protein
MYPVKLRGTERASLNLSLSDLEVSNLHFPKKYTQILKYSQMDVKIYIIVDLLIPGRGKIFSSGPQCPKQFSGLPNLLSSMYRGQGGRRDKLNTHLHLVQKSRMLEIYLLFPYAFLVCLMKPRGNFTFTSMD